MRGRDKLGKQDIKYINGLKGLLCFMIMIGHFLGVYKYAESFSDHIWSLDRFLDSFLSFLLDESWWLIAFYVISGYLIYISSKPNTLMDTIRLSVIRFFRLAVPSFFSCFVIYCIYILIGWHHKETAGIFTNSWLQERFYQGQYSIWNVLRSPVDLFFTADTTFNNPYWTLRWFLYSAICIYILKYLCTKINNKNLCLALVLAVGTFSFFKCSIIFMNLLGSFCAYVHDKKRAGEKVDRYIAILLMAAMIFHNNVSWNIMVAAFWVVVFIYISDLKLLSRFLESKVLIFLGKISWGIYSFHWSILFSIGTYLIIIGSNKVGLLYAYIMSFATCVCLTVVLSIIYNKTFGLLSDKLIGLLKEKWPGSVH